MRVKNAMAGDRKISAMMHPRSALLSRALGAARIVDRIARTELSNERSRLVFCERE